jgi:hypothetical protein
VTTDFAARMVDALNDLHGHREAGSRTHRGVRRLTPGAQLALGFSMFTAPPASYAQCRYFGIPLIGQNEIPMRDELVLRYEPGRSRGGIEPLT